MLFKDVKNIIIEQINKFKGVKAVFMQMYYKVNGELKSKIYSLNNEDGYNNAMNILNAKPFEMSENPFDEKDNYTIQVSDDASVSNFHLPISCIIGFRLTNKKHLTNKAGKQIKIYCDNGGAFYPYKVKPIFANNTYIMIMN